MQTTTPQKNVALKQGLIFGIGLGVLSIILGIISTATSGAGTIISVIGIIVGLVAYLFVGIRAASVTGKTGTGALAGLFTGIFSGLISGIGTIIIVFATIDSVKKTYQDAANLAHSSIQYTNSIVIGFTIVGVVVSLVVALALGAAIGAIGGLIGKRRAKVEEAPVYQDSYTGPTL